MQMRFDGFIGFPGGLGELSESVEAGLNRELEEEVGLHLQEYAISREDFMVCHLNHRTKLCLFFYTKEVKLKEFVAIKRNMFSAKDYGTEVNISYCTSLNGIRRPYGLT